MTTRAPLVGRDTELRVLRAALEGVGDGSGGVVFVRGETGIGKSRLVEEAVASWEGGLVRAAATVGAGPFAPLLAALDLRLDTPEAVTEALLALASERPAVCVLEDLHLAGAAALDVIGEAATRLAATPLLLLCSYDDVGLSRDHPLRRLRAALRRTGRFVEVRLAPLTLEESSRLVQALAGDSGLDAGDIHEGTGGLPFFVEEITRAQANSPSAGTALPETVIDAVLDATAPIREAAPDAVEYAAVMGAQVELAVLADLVPAPEVDRLLDVGLLVESGRDLAVFRHALVARALARAIPWSRRRERHRAVGAALAARGARPDLVAEHWLAAGLPDRARPLLLEAGRRSCEVLAWRDAARHVRRALADWPPEEPGRIEVLEGLADCVEKTGEPGAAMELWAEVAEAHRQEGDPAATARARRRLATAAELAGDLDQAGEARELAAEAYAAAGNSAEAALERLALSGQVRERGRARESLEHLGLARADAERSGDDVVLARVLASEGACRSALGQHEVGVALARDGLDLALRCGEPETIGASYYEFAEAMLHATDYAGSADAYEFAAGYCRDQQVPELDQACLACLSVAVRCQGDWDRALEVCQGVLDDPGTSEVVRMIALEEWGLITALRGSGRRARPALRSTLAFGHAAGVFGVEIGSAWGIAVAAVDGGSGGREAVIDLLDRCESTDDWNFALPGLRWAATSLAGMQEPALLARCQSLSGRAATHNSAPKVLSVLAHVGAEVALLEGDAGALDQFARSLQLLGSGGSRYERALATARWGVAEGTLGDREAAVARLVEAYRSARQLGARPLAGDCTRALAALGENVDRRLGRRAARTLDVVPLTARERQVLRLVAEGRTSRAIADDLVLSVRTVDMHVRNLLQKLDCPTRTAAARRAAELGILGAAETTAPPDG